MTAISQLQMIYSPEEDRVLLRLNTDAADEFRFWLTRRYCQMLIQALNEHRDVDPHIATQTTPDAKQAVQSFKQEAASAKGDFEQAFKQSTNFPLGDAPQLAFKLTYSVDQGKLKLSLQPKEGQGINLTLDQSLNFNVTKLLKSASDQAVWLLDWGSYQSEPIEDRVIN